jgi:hypothetical protein
MIENCFGSMKNKASTNVKLLFRLNYLEPKHFVYTFAELNRDKSMPLGILNLCRVVD